MPVHDLGIFFKPKILAKIHEVFRLLLKKSSRIAQVFYLFACDTKRGGPILMVSYPTLHKSFWRGWLAIRFYVPKLDDKSFRSNPARLPVRAILFHLGFDLWALCYITYSRRFPLHRHQTIHHPGTCKGYLSLLHPDLFENKGETKS